MHNKSLVRDFVKRAEKRLLAVDLLFREQSWADVVRESQEVVELALKALLRHCDVEVPRIHDVSGALDQERGRLPAPAAAEVEYLINVSRTLRRDRELSFCGSEDLTPSEFYTKADAAAALEMARRTHALVAASVGKFRDVALTAPAASSGTSEAPPTPSRSRRRR